MGTLSNFYDISKKKSPGIRSHCIKLHHGKANTSSFDATEEDAMEESVSSSDAKEEDVMKQEDASSSSSDATEVRTLAWLRRSTGTPTIAPEH